jgi:5-methylcytosine-specific restriction endonuclease McrA
MSTRPGLARGGYRIRATVRRLAQRDGNLCAACLEPIDLSLSGLDPDGPTLGHVISAAHGGTDHDANLCLEHRRCNLAHSSRTLQPVATTARPPVRTT